MYSNCNPEIKVFPVECTSKARIVKLSEDLYLSPDVIGSLDEFLDLYYDDYTDMEFIVVKLTDNRWPVVIVIDDEEIMSVNVIFAQAVVMYYLYSKEIRIDTVYTHQAIIINTRNSRIDVSTKIYNQYNLKIDEIEPFRNLDDIDMFKRKYNHSFDNDRLWYDLPDFYIMQRILKLCFSYLSSLSLNEVLNRKCQAIFDMTHGNFSVQIKRFLNLDPETSFIRQLKDVPYLKIYRSAGEMCCVCLDNSSSIVFGPCGHLVTCKDCCKKCTKCSICRGKIDYIVISELEVES